MRPSRPASAVSSRSPSPTPRDVIEFIQAGARGYVTKIISPPSSPLAVLRVHKGEAVFSPRLAGFVLDALHAHQPARPVDPDAAHDRASARSSRHIARGYPYKEIAARLGDLDRSRREPRAAVLRKLQLANRHRWRLVRPRRLTRTDPLQARVRLELAPDLRARLPSFITTSAVKSFDPRISEEPTP